MARKFMLAAEKGRHPACYGNRPSGSTKRCTTSSTAPSWTPQHWPRLETPDTPDVHQATIEAHRIKLWGKYPALVMGLPEQTVHGVACKIKTRDEADRLTAYETAMYGADDGCVIRLEDGTALSGWTFDWNADE